MGIRGRVNRPFTLGLAVIVATLAASCGGSSDQDGAPSANRINALIRADEYTRLVVELDYVEGLAPRSDALQHAADELEGVLDKPAGVEFVLDQALEPFGSDKRWRESEVYELAERYEDLPLDDHTVGIHIVIVDGTYVSSAESNTTTVGLAWGSKSIVLFMEAIRAICAGADLPANVRDDLCHVTEQSIILHEIGHLIGLVNHGLPMQSDHEDPEHAHHCDNDDCVMYWCYERVHALEALRDRFMAGDTTLGTFGSSCVADIDAVRQDATTLAALASIDASTSGQPEWPYACTHGEDAD